MKKFLIVVALWFATVSCNNINGGFILTGEIIGAEQGEKIMLSYPLLKDGVWYVQRLTADVVDGTFRFEGELQDLMSAHLSFENMDEVQIFIEPRRMTIEMERERPYAFKMQGVSAWPESEEYRKALEDVSQILFEKNRALQNANMAWVEAEQRADVSADSLKSVFYDAILDLRLAKARELECCHRFLSEHSDYAIAPYMLYYLAFNEAVDDDELLELYDGLSQQVQQSAIGKLAKQRVELVTSQMGGFGGDTAFDFERVEVLSGKRVRMSDYLKDGGYLLLDFWASWCGPCVEQMPNVKRLYDKYSARGLRVIGVSTDDDPSAWQNAIEKYGLARYPQVLSRESSEQELFFDELADIATRYEVNSIPCFILIDHDGKIVERWQHFDDGRFELIDNLF